MMALQRNETAFGSHQRAQQMRPLFEIYTELGHALFTLGRYAEAAQAFRDSIHERPDSGELHLYLARAYHAQDRFDDALRGYLEAARLSPEHASDVLANAHTLLTRSLAKPLSEWLEKSEWRRALAKADVDADTGAAIYLFLGRVNLYCENFHQALTDFQIALEIKPRDVFSLEGLGEALWHEHRAIEAVKTLRLAVDRADQSDALDRRATSRLKLARVLLDLGRLDLGRRQEAKGVLEQALSLKPANLNALQVLFAQNYFALGEPEQALRFADRVLAQDEKNIEANAVRAAALYELGNYAEAAQAAEATQKLAPDHLEAIRVRAQAIIEGSLDKDLTLAIRLLQVYLRQQPEDMERQRLLIQTLRQIGRSGEEMTEALEQASSNAPSEERPALMLELAEAYLEEKNSAKVITTLEAVAGQDPGLKSAHWWQLYGDAQRQDKRLKAALQSYQHGLELAPTDRSLLEGCAEISEDLNEWRQAAEIWRRVFKTAPNESKAHLSLAQALTRLGDFSEALSEAERALSLENDYDRKARGYTLKAEILMALERPLDDVAEAYYEAGLQQYGRSDYEAATDLFERANKLNPNHLPTYWNLMEGLRIRSGKPEPPHVSADLIDESLRIWAKGIQQAFPGKEDSWAYLARAAINEQLARRPGADRWALGWEALCYCERALVLSPGDVPGYVHLGQWCRFLGLDAGEDRVTAEGLVYGENDLNALEGRIICLTNAGQYDQAQPLIDKRRDIDKSSWPDAVEAYIKARRGAPQEALQLIENAVKDFPDEVWYREVRALCYQEARQPLEAEKDFRWIVDRYDPNDVGNQMGYGNAAYKLGLMHGKVDCALEIYQRFFADRSLPTDAAVRLNFGLCRLANGDLEGGRDLMSQGIAYCRNQRLLSELLNTELAYLEEASERWAFGMDLRNILDHAENGLKVQMRSRMAEIAQHPPSAEEELHRLLASRPAGDAGGWLSIGVHAGLARLCVEQKRWCDAATEYQSLRRETDCFPEARLGLLNVIERVQLESDRSLKEKEPAASLEQLSTALTLAQQNVPEDPKIEADVRGRMGFVHFILADSSNARLNFQQAIALYRKSGRANPGTALGTVCLQLLSRDTDYWGLDEEWKSLRSDPGSDKELQTDLADAELSLAAHLKPMARIVVEVGSALLEFEEKGGWPLFERLPVMRERIQKDTGVQVPGTIFRDDSRLPPVNYVIKFDEIPIAQGRIEIDRDYCIASREDLDRLGIPQQNVIEVPHPLTGDTGFWVDRSCRAIITSTGLQRWEQPDLFLAYHLEAVLRANLAEFLGFQDTRYLLKRWQNSKPASTLAAAVDADINAEIRLTRLLRSLVKEKVTIAPLEEIIGVSQTFGLASDDIGGVVQAVRLRLKRSLPGNDRFATRLPLPPELEAKIAPWLQQQDAKMFLAMPPEEAEELLSSIRALVRPFRGSLVLVSESGELRPFIRRLVEAEFPDLMVLSRAELVPQDELAGSS